MDAFERLHPGVQYHLANTLRWNGLRPTQAQAVGPVLAGQDTLVLAPTAGYPVDAARWREQATPAVTRLAVDAGQLWRQV